MRLGRFPLRDEHLLGENWGDHAHWPMTQTISMFWQAVISLWSICWFLYLNQTWRSSSQPDTLVGRRCKVFGQNNQRSIFNDFMRLQVKRIVTLNLDRNVSSHSWHPLGKWPLDRIVQTYPGADNLVRVVSIKTGTSSILQRPITKVCPLSIDTPFEECSSPESTKAGGNVWEIKAMEEATFTPTPSLFRFL